MTKIYDIQDSINQDDPSDTEDHSIPPEGTSVDKVHYLEGGVPCTLLCDIEGNTHLIPIPYLQRLVSGEVPIENFEKGDLIFRQLLNLLLQSLS